jgi:hypothetical protein
VSETTREPLCGRPFRRSRSTVRVEVKWSLDVQLSAHFASLNWSADASVAKQMFHSDDGPESCESAGCEALFGHEFWHPARRLAEKERRCRGRFGFGLLACDLIKSLRGRRR